MADTMIEQAAREMFRLRRKAQGVAYFGGQDEIETDWRVCKSLYIADARAVLAVMREPTGLMIANGVKPSGYGFEIDEARVALTWKAMIDAARAEGG